MNAPEERFLTVTLGEAEVRVPREAALMAYLEQQIDARRPFPPMTIGLRSALQQDCAAAIGSVNENGEIYAGLTLHEGKPMELFLLPGDRDEITWPDALVWAADQGGMLPSRIDALVLWQNLRGQFKQEAYWTSEEYADDAGYAWYQLFPWGDQGTWPKSHKYRARAVRRLPI